MITLSPQSLKITVKNHRLGIELPWKELISGERALAVALHASVGKFEVGAINAPAVQELSGAGNRSDASGKSAEVTPVPKSNAKDKARPSQKSKRKTLKRKRTR